MRQSGTPPPTCLLLTEWQGYGLSPIPADGARCLAEVLFAGREIVVVEAPREEALEVTGGVLGLMSIAPRFGRALAALLRGRSDRVVTIGGTCGVELAPVAHLNAVYAGDLAVLWFDAHADLNTPASSPSGHFHGMVLRTLLGDGPAELVGQIPLTLRPRQVFLVGAREFDAPEAAYVAATGLAVLGGDEAFDDPDMLVAKVRAAGFGRIYVHFDVDVVNPADFGSSLMATPGGPALDRVTRVLRLLFEACDVVGFSVVEYCDRSSADRDRLCATVADLLQRPPIGRS